MRLLSVNLSNFRSAESANINLDENITILIGKNGSGKTTILDGIARGLDTIRSLWPHGTTATTGLPRIDISQARDPAKEVKISLDLDIESQPPLFDDLSFNFIISSNRTNAIQLNNSMYKFFTQQAQSGLHRPLFIYYRQDRAFESKQRTKTSSLSSHVFEDALFGESRLIGDLEEWWDKRDAEEARFVRDNVDHSYRDVQLEAIRSLVREMDTFLNVSFSSIKTPPGLYFTKDDGASVHVSSLSSGERSYIILLADLARRLQMSAPNLPLGKISGIILIDEIELNLHPAWQSAIITTLNRVFKSCQFIIATHSPQVLSAVQSKCVRVLQRRHDGTIIAKIPQSTKGRSINYILEGIFETPERLPAIDEKIAEFNNAIDAKDPRLADRILSDIIQSIEGNPPEILVFKKRLRQIQEQK